MKNLIFSLLIIAFFAMSCSGEQEQKNNDTAPSSIENTDISAAPLEVKPLEDEKVLRHDTVVKDLVDNLNRNIEKEGRVVKAQLKDNSAVATNVNTNTTSSSKTSAKVNTTPTNNNTTTSNRNTPPPPPSTTSTTTTSSSKTTTTTRSNNTTTNAPTPPPTIEDTKPALSHAIFDGLLRKYVNSSGGVNYSGLKKEEGKLKSYLDLLAQNPPQSSWSKNKEMAYWINLYNAFTIATILKEYPVKSVMDIEGGKVWDKRTIKIGGKSYTLNKIEKDMLLKKFKEPRVHFAVNCAAASCPPLLNKAWTEDNVQRYYNTQAKAFINNSKYNTISAKKLEVSQIFNWYAGDFGGSDKIVPYFQKYSNETIKDGAKVMFKEYDWSLNKQ